MTLRNRALGRTRGDWAPTTLYLRDDVVTHLGVVYTAKATFTSDATFAAADWDQVSDELPPPHSHPFDTTTGDARYPLRTDTDPFPQYTTAAEVATLASGTKSTVSAGLPTLVDRDQGDLHYNETNEQEYVVTGIGGDSVTDDFNRADGSSPAIGGQTMVEGGRVDASIFNNALRLASTANGTGRFFLFDAGTGNAEIEATYLAPNTGAGQQGGILVLKNPTVADGALVDPTGYTLQADTSAQTHVLRLRRAGVEVGTFSLGNQGGAAGGELRLTYTQDGASAIIRGFFNDVERITYTDADPLTGTFAGLSIANLSSTDYDNFTYHGLGTLAWTSTDQYVEVHSHGGRVGDSPLSTVGPGLATFAGRRQGDLHYDETNTVEFVLKGLAGAYAEDTFTRADSPLFGSTTEIGGLVWGGDVDNRIENGAFVYDDNPASGAASLQVGTGKQSVEIVFDSDNAGGAGAIYVGANEALTAYVLVQWVQDRDPFSGTPGQITLTSPGGQTGNLGAANVAVPTSFTGLILAVDYDPVAATVKVTITGEGIGTQVFDFPLNPVNAPSNPYIFVLPNSGQGRIHSVKAQGSGTLEWIALLPKRKTRTFTTDSVAAGAFDAGFVTLAPGYRLLDIDASHACRVRLYTSDNRRILDEARTPTTDPPKGSGLMLDYSVTTPGGADEGLSPLVDGYVADGTDQVAYTVTNDDAAAQAVTVTLTWVRTE